MNSPEWMIELSRVKTPFVVAGGAIVNLVYFGENFITDIDIFSPDPEALISELGVTAEKNGLTYRAGCVDFVDFKADGDYVSMVLGSFDFNISACGWDGMIESEPVLCVSEQFLEAIQTGVLEFLPQKIPEIRKSRSAHRANKYSQRFGFDFGPRLSSFLMEYLKDIKLDMQPGLVFALGKPLPYKRMPLSDVQKLAKPPGRPRHVLELLFGS